MSRPQFKLALWPTLAAATGIALTLALGNWQLERGNEKADLAERIKIASRDALIELPRIATPAQAGTVVGLASVPSRRYLELSTKVAEGNVWQNRTLERYRAAVPIAVQPLVIQQENDLNDGLQRVWSAPDHGIEKHYGYAFQWFALAVEILVFYLVTHVKKRAREG